MECDLDLDRRKERDLADLAGDRDVVFERERDWCRCRDRDRDRERDRDRRRRDRDRERALEEGWYLGDLELECFGLLLLLLLLVCDGWVGCSSSL